MKRVVFIVLALFLAACGGNTTQPATPQAPTIDSFSASPPTIAAANDAATLNWSITGSYDTLQLTDSTSTNVLNVSGTSFTVNPSVTTTYRLTATGDGGSASSETTVVLQGTDPTPQPTPTPPETPPTNPDPPETPPNNPDPPSNPPGSPAKPTINNFRAVQDTVEAGGTVGLQWSVTGADTLEIDNGVGTVTGTSVVVTVPKTTTYKLTATNKGGSVSKSATVKVAAPGSDVPNRGRWIVYFETDTAAYVYELNITEAVNTAQKNGGQGKHLFCHVNLTGTPCSTFSKSEGTGFIGKFTYNDGRVVDALILDGGELGIEFMSGYELTYSKTKKGETVISGSGEFIPPNTAEEIFGTIRAVNIGEPRNLE